MYSNPSRRNLISLARDVLSTRERRVNHLLQMFPEICASHEFYRSRTLIGLYEPIDIRFARESNLQMSIAFVFRNRRQCRCCARGPSR